MPVRFFLTNLGVSTLSIIDYLDIPRHETLTVLPSQTREQLSPENAIHVETVLKHYNGGIKVINKRIDSTLRGNLG